ncbi:MAG: T9SS type A sorting domain-containing protein, partial [Bacteroidota bacterium]
PLDNGNLLFSNEFFGGGEERFDYSLFNPEGQLIWTESIEGENYNLRPVTQTDDGGFLFVNRFDPFSRRDEALQILKTDARGALSSNCNTFEADKLIDLELSISSDNTNIPIFTSETFTLTLVNNGPDDATDVEVQLAIDNERFVEVGESMPTASIGNYFQGVWSDINLAAGESATLQVDIFSKSETLELFAQVIQANQADVDSSPSNAVCCVTSEDDEAVFTSNDGNFRREGSANLISNNTYQLTPALNNQAGSIWSINNIDLSQDFSLDAAIYLGSRDGGADGIAFVLQPFCSNLGNTSRGEFIGYGGISPSLIVEFDTYQNDFDPSPDHVAIIRNGDGNHNSNNTLGNPFEVANLEDDTFHDLFIQWDADGREFTVSLDGEELYSGRVGDIVTDIFLGEPLVHWGFTAATGGLNNEHRVRINAFEATEQDSNCNGNANLEQRSSTISPEILIYPNPTTAILQIKNVADRTFYQIHDVLGKRLMEGQINDQQLDLSALPSGTYFLSIGTKARQVVRFVKQ